MRPDFRLIMYWFDGTSNTYDFLKIDNALRVARDQVRNTKSSFMIIRLIDNVAIAQSQWR